MKVRIEIDTQTFVRFWLVVIGFALMGLLIYSARVALILVGTALFLAIALSKPVNYLANRLPGKSRVVSTTISFVAIVAFLTGFISLVVPPVLEQSAKIAESVPALVDGAQAQWKGFEGIVNQYHLESQVDQAANTVKQKATEWAANLGQAVVNGIGSFASFFTAALLVLVMTFLMLVEAPVWTERIWRLYRDVDRKDHHRDLIGKMYHVVTNYVTGQITISFIGASCAGLCVFILSRFFDIPANLTMPIIAMTFVLSLIPMFGATIAGVIATALIALNDPPAAIIYAIYFFVYQQFENNFVSPTVQARSVKLSALAVLVAATTGLYLIGPIGGIVAIPIAGCVKVLMEDYLNRSRETRKQQDKPIAKLVKKLSGEDAVNNA